MNFFRAAWAQVHAAFHQQDTRIYAVVQSLVWLLILVSVGLFLAELLFGIQFEESGAVVILDNVILWIFVLEINLRILSYRDRELSFFDWGPAQRLRLHVWTRFRYSMTPLNLVDLFTVLAVVPELRGLRALRLLRLLRSPRLFKYANPFTGLARAFTDNRFLFYFAFSILAIQVLFGGISIYLIEGATHQNIDNIADGFWWALVTITTVGFGDIAPVTPIGRTVASVLMVGGMFTLALFAGVVGQTLITSFMSLRKEQYRMTKFIDHVVICGYNQGARMLLYALRDELRDASQVVIFAPGERDPDVPPEFAWVDGTPTKESELDKVRPQYARAVVIVGARKLSPPQADAATILTAFTFRRYLANRELEADRQKPIYIVAEILEEENVDHARAAGADEVIETTQVGFSMIAHSVAQHGTARIIGRVAHAGSNSLYIGYRVDRETCSPQPFGELAAQLKKEHDILVLGYRNNETGDDRLNPPIDELVSPGDEMIYLSTSAKLPD